MSSSIQFIVQDTSNAFKERRKLKVWLFDVAKSEGLTIEALNFVLMSDDALLEYNKQYLQHDYFTDVITFDNSMQKSVIVGDVLMSLDRIKENASGLSISTQMELRRVMVHGLLHLMGYEDKTPAKQKKMREMEDKHLLAYGR